MTPDEKGTDLSWEIEFRVRGAVLGLLFDRLLLGPVMAVVLALSLRRLRAVVSVGHPAPKAVPPHVLGEEGAPSSPTSSTPRAP